MGAGYRPLILQAAMGDTAACIVTINRRIDYNADCEPDSGAPLTSADQNLRLKTA